MRLLLVEDDDGIRECLTEILQDYGHEVDVAANGRVALDRLQQGHQYDLMLLDMVMPEVSGWTLLNELMRRGLLLPTVIITASHGAMPVGFGVLRKPFSIEALNTAMEHCLAEQHPSL